jgi:hypothetical protein
MVPESHELTFTASTEVKEYLKSPEFQSELVEKLRSQHVVEVSANKDFHPPADQPDAESLILSYTRNNAGGLKDAIDFFIAGLVVKGLDADTVKGAIPRPKSDSFEESLPYFESKLLHRAEPAMGTDSPTRSVFGETENEASGFFAKFRKPGSMSSFTSLMERRKNGSNSPGSLFKHASSNASKASLASLESQGSGYRNPWNDSGINLPEEEHPATQPQNGHGWPIPQPQLYAHPSHQGYGFNGTTPVPGDATPTSRYDPRASVDSGRPSTSHSLSGYPGNLR